MALVTVLLAAYNNDKYIAELLDSLLSQSMGDIRVLARDDASSDGTLGILREYEKKDRRVEVIAGTRSGSAENNFFALLAEPDDSPYVMFADADDVWLPEKVQHTLDRMRTLEAERGAETPLLVHCDLCVTDEDLYITAPSLRRYEKLSPERTRLRELLAQNNVTGCAMMANRALARFAVPQPEHAVMHDWWLALAASAFGGISFVDEPLILYRQHSSNQVGAYDAKSLSASAKRLADSARTRRIYSAMFAQADAFADAFEDRLSPAQLRLCRAYASMQNKKKPGRILTVMRYGFYKNTFLRNLGQFVAI